MLNLAATDVLQKIYESKKETIEYYIKFGNKSEREKALFIKETACMSF